MLFACGVFSVGFIIAGGAVPLVFGMAVACLCLLGWWSLYQEIRFGVMSEKVGNSLAGKKSSKKYDLYHKINNDSGCAHHERECDFWLAQVKNNSDVYGNWYRLALAYDEAGSRKDARAAMREAIQLYNRQGGAGIEEKV